MTELGNWDCFNPHLSGKDWHRPGQEGAAPARGCGGWAAGAATSAPSSRPAPEALLDVRVDRSSVTAPRL